MTEQQTKTEQSTDGLEQWSTRLGLTTHQKKERTAPGAWTATTTAPDESQAIATYLDGLQTSVVTKASSSGPQLSAVTTGYDPHNRAVTQTDARNGTTTTTYDALDRVTSVTQPSADGIASGLVTSYSYNVLGQRTKVTLPDSSETDYEYHPTGELKRVFLV